MRRGSKYVRQMMIFANEVPVISAMNPYRSIDQVFFDVWNRTEPKKIALLLDKLQIHIPTPEEIVHESIRDAGAEASINSLMEQASKADTIDKVVEAAKAVEKAIPSTTPIAVKEEIVQFIKSEMNKEFGAKQEASAIAHYEEKQQVVVKEKNLVFSKKKIASLDKYDVYVGGKIDGKAGEKVIEVKNRLNRFMNPLPKYDIAQLQTYLYILDAKEGELVEHLKKDVAQSKMTIVPRDLRMWETEILPFLLRFSNALGEFLKDEEAQAQYLSSEPPERKEIIRTHWMKELHLKEKYADH
jgi:hypothetical protein